MAIHEFLRVARQLGCLDDDGVEQAAQLVQAAAATGQPVDVGTELLKHQLMPEADVKRIQRVIASKESPAVAGDPTADSGTANTAGARTPGGQSGQAVLPDIGSLAGMGLTPAESDCASVAGQQLDTSPNEVAQKHRVVDLVGRSNGEVQLARDRDLRRNVAIKVLLDASDGKQVEQFVEEAQITGQLEHPNIVPVYELGFAGNQPFLVMKHVDGDTLHELIVRARKDDDGPKPLTPDELRRTLEVFTKVAQAIAFAHHNGVIHRNIKPSNIMIGRFGEVLVVDWGLARILSPELRTDPGSGETLKTDASERRPAIQVAQLPNDADEEYAEESFEITGSPAWMPPEQASDNTLAMDERSDVFALGALLYTQLTLMVPYTGKTARKVLARAASGQFTPPRKRAPERGIPRELGAIVGKAMSKEPTGRYGSVHELLGDIDAFQSNRPVSALRDGLLRQALKWSRRNPRATLVTALSVVFVSIVASIVATTVQQVANADARAARSEQVVLRAQAEAAASDSRAARSEQQRLRAATDAAMAESQAAADLEASLRVLARRQQWEELARAIGAGIRQSHNEAIEEFERLYEAAMKLGESETEFIKSPGRQKISLSQGPGLTPWCLGTGIAGTARTARTFSGHRTALVPPRGVAHDHRRGLRRSDSGLHARN